MSKIKVSELFYSIQGEGRWMGVPSVFLRTFGCNFTCSGFGMPRGQCSTERDEVAAKVSLYKTYKDLPLVSTGCDSYASWDTRFKDLSPQFTVDEIAKKIYDILPQKQWRGEHLVITGGEPLLGWQRAYPKLLQSMPDLKDLTFETNGTQKLTADLKDYFTKDWLLSHNREITFSVSPKLPCSGEAWENAILPPVVCEYERYGFTYLKFVVADMTDVDDALRAVALYRKEGFSGPVYLMPVGGVESVYSLNNRRVAELCMQHSLRYSDRLQVPLFKNAWGT